MRLTIRTLSDLRSEDTGTVTVKQRRSVRVVIDSSQVRRMVRAKNAIKVPLERTTLAYIPDISIQVHQQWNVGRYTPTSSDRRRSCARASLRFTALS